MKCAYFAFDKLALNTKNKLSENYSHIDYYLMKDEDPVCSESVDELEIMVSHLCISQNESLQTEFQKKYLRNISGIINTYKSNIYVSKPSKIQQEVGQELQSNPAIMNVQLVDELLFIKWDRNLNKYCVENKQRQLVEYDFIIIENNQFLMSAIIDKQENLFFSFTEQTQYILNLEFQAVWKHVDINLEKTFILICDEDVNSIADNCFVLKISGNKINCLVQLPMPGIKNEDFLDFIRNKIETILHRKLFILKSLNFISAHSRPTDGFYKFKAQLRNSRFGALVPSYFLWNSSARDAHLNSVMKSRGTLKLGSDNKWKKSDI